MAGDLVTVSAAGTRLFALAGHTAAEPTELPPRLLGHFDPFLLGYRDRGLVLDPGYAPRIQTGGGFVQPVVLIGGRAAGTWRLTRVPGRARRARLTVQPFTVLPAASADGLAAEAADIGRFLGVDVALETVETWDGARSGIRGGEAGSAGRKPGAAAAGKPGPSRRKGGEEPGWTSRTRSPERSRAHGNG